MDALTEVWNALLVDPIQGALLQLTTLTSSAGLAIVIFTVVVRTVLLPLSIQQIRSQRAMMGLQPRLREIQRRFGGDRQHIAQEQMRLYKEAGVHPLAGCLPMLIQMPIWIALYSSLITLSQHFEAFQASFLWIPNLAAPSLPVPQDPTTYQLAILPVLAGGTQWVVQRMATMPTADPQQQQMNAMMNFMPIMFLIFAVQVAAGLALYWVVSNVYSIVQQRIMVGWGNLPFLGGSSSDSDPSGGTPGSAPKSPDRPPPQRPRRRRKKK